MAAAAAQSQFDASSVGGAPTEMGMNRSVTSYRSFVSGRGPSFSKMSTKEKMSFMRKRMASGSGSRARQGPCRPKIGTT